ncbi:MAG: D-alanyl-D-alanine carboxypeptidase [Alphaproteobacteria bacterium]|nr:D-alanyl-D-alanine carboxypeptidase [Alphaproteobacteria bacterium]
MKTCIETLAAGLIAGLIALAAGNAGAQSTIETAAGQMILVDYKTGAVLAEKNSDEMMPPSSMSKIMTMYVVFDHLRQGKLSLDSDIPISERAWRKQGSKMFVTLNSRVKVEDLIRGVIVQSGNDACIALAEALYGSEDAFAQELTRRGKLLGLKSTNFTNSTGWPDPDHLTTARDLAILAKRMIADFPDYYRYYSELEYTYNSIKQGNRNPLLYKNMGADGLKTGHTAAAGYGLTASVKRDNRRLILVINGMKSMGERAAEAERLMDWGFREYENVALFKAGEAVETAAVWLGHDKSVPMVLAEDVEMTLLRRARKDMKVTVVYEKPVPAPIAAGQAIGKLRVNIPNVPPIEFPLLAQRPVEQLGFIGRINAAAHYLVFGAAK